MALARGDVAAARDALGESLELFRRVSDQRGLAYALYSLGSVALQDDDVAGAQEHFWESLEHFETVNDSYGAFHSLTELIVAWLEVEPQAVVQEVGKLWRGALEIARDGRTPRCVQGFNFVEAR